MFYVLYGMSITNTTALVLEVPCAECFHRKIPQKWEENWNTGDHFIYECVHLLQVP